ncbi:MAG: serine/threonine protein kinase [Polyangiaceae bacterium]|nr:serine/threonine protein kinase [Polyangiaceae bacterium]
MFPASPLPERVGAYRVLRCLSSTGGVDLYLCREDGPLGFSREVLLKVAPREAGEADELLREASAVAQLNHPALQRMFAFFEHEGRVALVLERLEGTTLARINGAARRRKQRLSEASAFHVAHRLFGALAHAHDAAGRPPVIHRAIHPGNVSIGWDGATRLTGFGMSKIVGRSPDTAIGLVKGVDGYMAPEQVRGERVTERVDVYQAGLVVWELLSGEPVPGSPQQTRGLELVQMMAGERLPSFGDLRAAIPREIVAVLDAALEPDADKRGITPREIERWLEKSVDVEGGREALRERAIALRAAGRSETGGGAGSGQYAVRASSPRFPGVATRVTGRVGRDDAPMSERPPPPSTQAPPVSRSAYPPRPGKVPTLRPGAPPLGPPPRQPPPKPSSVKKTMAGLAPLKPLPTIEPVARVEPAAGSLPGFSPAPPPAFSAPPPDAAPPSYVGPAPVAPVAPPVFAGPPMVAPPVAPRESGPRAPLPSVSAVRSRRVVLIAVVASIVSVLALGTALAAVFALRKPDEPPPAPAATQPPPAVSSAPVAPNPPAPAAPPAAPSADAPASDQPLLAIGPREGALVVTSSAEGEVYANGKRVGAIGATLVVPCGRKFLRIGRPGVQIVWTSKGVSAVATCGTTTKIDLPALPPPRGRR